MADWYVKQRNAVSGPFSWEELRFLSERGKIAAGESVRQGSAGEWVAVEKMRGLLTRAVVSGDAAPPKSVAAATSKPLEGPAAATQPSTAPAKNLSTPPPLPKGTSDSSRRWPVVLAAGTLAVVFILLLLLLAGVYASRGTASTATGSASSTGNSSQGTSSQSTDGDGTSVGQGEGDAQGADESVSGDRKLPGAEDSQPSAAPPSADEPNDAAESPLGVPQGTAEGNGTGGAPHRRAPPPRSAAVIMPLDDEDSTVGDDSTTGGRSGGSAEFFQIQGKGRRFIYVVDCSDSMAGAPFEKAQAELRRSIEALKSGQSFFVIFFDDADYPQFYPSVGDGMLRASSANKGRIRKWINEFSPPGSGTDPSAAMLRALRLQPDAIYLLSDGEFDPNIADQVRSQNTKRVAIHTISFMTRQAEFLLQQIANENHGTYRFVP